jgi:hypothetical protein
MIYFGIESADKESGALSSSVASFNDFLEPGKVVLVLKS